jgi:hypothetical protein
MLFCGFVLASLVIVAQDHIAAPELYELTTSLQSQLHFVNDKMNQLITENRALS